MVSNLALHILRCPGCPSSLSWRKHLRRPLWSWEHKGTGEYPRRVGAAPPGARNALGTFADLRHHVAPACQISARTSQPRCHCHQAGDTCYQTVSQASQGHLSPRAGMVCLGWAPPRGQLRGADLSSSPNPGLTEPQRLALSLNIPDPLSRPG